METNPDREPQEDVHSCGYPEDSFACRIRHVAVLSGNSEAKKHDKELRGRRQESVYGV